jgi:hypothetical protein
MSAALEGFATKRSCQPAKQASTRPVYRSTPPITPPMTRRPFGALLKSRRSLARPSRRTFMRLVGFWQMGPNCKPLRGWNFGRNPLIIHVRFSLQLGKKRRGSNDECETLNQRVQGSSPCAPTN